MSEYTLSSFSLKNFIFQPKHWIGEFTIVFSNDSNSFLTNVPFSYSKNWYFNDFTFPFDCSTPNRASLKLEFHRLASDFCHTLYENFILPREKNAFVPAISNLSLIKSNLDTHDFTFSFNLSQHSPIFYLDISKKGNFFHYRFTCSKKLYTDHMTSLYFNYYLFKKVEALFSDFKSIRMALTTSPFFHKEKPVFD